MKKITSILLALAVVFSLTACSEDNDKAADKNTKSTAGTETAKGDTKTTPVSNGTFEGDKNGYGVWNDGRACYIGDFKDGVPNGLGTLYVYRSDEIKMDCAFTGAWVNGIGSGKMVYRQLLEDGTVEQFTPVTSFDGKAKYRYSITCAETGSSIDLMPLDSIAVPPWGEIKLGAAVIETEGSWKSQPTQMFSPMFSPEWITESAFSFKLEDLGNSLKATVHFDYLAEEYLFEGTMMDFIIGIKSESIPFEGCEIELIAKQRSWSPESFRPDTMMVTTGDAEYTIDYANKDIIFIINDTADKSVLDTIELGVEIYLNEVGSKYITVKQ